MSTGTINVTDPVQGIISFPQRDYDGGITTNRYSILNAGSAGTFTNTVGEYTFGLVQTDLDNLATLYYNFLNGSGSTTREQKLAAGATLGTNGYPSITSKSIDPENMTDWTVPPQAQRELKWRITLQDTVTGEYYTSDIGCCNASILENNNEQIPATQRVLLEEFLAGPEVTGRNESLTPQTQDFNLPIVVSKVGNPLRYVTSSVVGVRFKKN